MKTIQQTNPIMIIGVELRTSNEVAIQTIPPFWEKFYKENILQSIPNRVSDDIFAVYTNFENEGKNNQGLYSLIIGAQVENFDKIPKDYTSTTIQPSKRVVFEVEKGRQDKVGEKWMEIWQHNELEKTFIAEYEQYKSSGEIEIFIGIK